MRRRGNCRYLKFAYLEMGDYPGYLAEMKKEAFLLHDASLSAIGTAARKGFAAHPGEAFPLLSS
jgi:hypothetical protein